MPPLNVSLVSINAWPLIGGLELVGHRVCHGLQEAGYRSQMIARFTRKRYRLHDYFRTLERGGYKNNDGVSTIVITLRWWERLLWLPLFHLIWRPSTFPFAVALHNLVMVPKMVRLLRESHIAHFLGGGPELLGFSVAAAAQKLGIPFVVEPALHPGQWGDSWIDLHLYRKAHQLLVHSRAERDVLAHYGVSTSRISLITHGVDRLTDGDAQRFRQTHQISSNTPIILFLGRKTREKGVFRLLTAFAAVRAHLQDVLLVFAGPSQLDPSIQGQEAVLDLVDLSDAAKQDALAACTLLCVPSEGESFGLVYYEAWQFSKPVVALDLPSLRESILHHAAGLLVNSERPDDLVRSLIDLITKPSLASWMGGNGRRLVESHFWEAAIDSYCKAYHKVLQDNEPFRGCPGF